MLIGKLVFNFCLLAPPFPLTVYLRTLESLPNLILYDIGIEGSFFGAH